MFPVKHRSTGPTSRSVRYTVDHVVRALTGKRVHHMCHVTSGLTRSQPPTATLRGIEERFVSCNLHPSIVPAGSQFCESSFKPSTIFPGS
jgi:hypothetical protein